MRLVPQIQESNLEDYNQLMSEVGLRTISSQRKPYFPIRKIYRCYKYFLDRLTALIDEIDGIEAKSNVLLSIYEKIKSAMVVKIEVSSHADAYVLFESLNNRGTPLTANIYEKTIEILKQNCLDDSAFEERLRGNLYKENVDATRYLLCSLAEHNMTDESNNTLWDRYGSGNYIWTIEHIFPEGENVPQEWVDMIADGDRSKAKEYLYEYTHKLGNLTMTGYNSALSNYSFEKKKR